MPFFTGEYTCKIDAKGRMVLPSRMKSHLPEMENGELMVRRGFEPCLVVYTMSDYKKIYAKVSGLNEFNEAYRKLQRNFFRGNTQVDLDATGRFLIPKSMLQYASINKEAIVIGMGNRIEVWDPSSYDQYLISDPAEFSALAQKYLDPKNS